MQYARDYAGVAFGLVLQIVMTCGADIDDVCYYGSNDKLPLFIRLLCDQIGGLENKVDTDITVPQYLPAELEDSFSRSTRGGGAYTRPGMFYGMRIQRGGNYIRFGRSYGGRSERGDGHYVRFGRSATPPPTSAILPETTEKPTMVKRSAGTPFASALGMDKKFMRFGKRSYTNDANNQNARKRFMRFGKRPVSNPFADGLIADKKFMRFGKRDGGNGKTFDGGTQFMRFGKRADYSGTDSAVDTNTVNDQVSMYKLPRYPSFYVSQPYLIKAPVMNAATEQDPEDPEAMGLADNDDVNKRSDDSARYTDKDSSGEKRFMRFGRAGLPDAFQMNGEKRFMRFGKRGETTVEDVDPNKRFMRFGKREDVEANEEEEGDGVRIRRSIDDNKPDTSNANSVDDTLINASDDTANQNGGSYMEPMVNTDGVDYKGMTNKDLEHIYNDVPLLKFPSADNTQNPASAAKDIEQMYNSIPLLSFPTKVNKEIPNRIPATGPTTSLLNSGAHALNLGAHAPQLGAHAPRSERQVMRFGKGKDLRLTDSMDSDLKTSYDTLNKLQRHFEKPAKRQDEILEPVQTHSS